MDNWLFDALGREKERIRYIVAALSHEEEDEDTEIVHEVRDAVREFQHEIQDRTDDIKVYLKKLRTAINKVL